MRNIYVDEAGISGAPQENISLVVALIVHADTQWRPVIQEMARLVTEYVPKPRQFNFTFHAKELFARNKFPDWEYEQRKLLMCGMMSIPRRFHIPMAIGAVRRNANNWTGWPVKKMSKQEIDHLMSFVFCMGAADAFVRQYCGEEVAHVFAERVPRIEQQLNRAVGLLRGRPLALSDDGNPASSEINEKTHLYVTRIIDEVHFMGRFYGPFLQIADACAFGLRRRYHALTSGEQFLRAIVGDEERLPPSDFKAYGEVFFQGAEPGAGTGQLPPGERLPPGR